MGRAEVLDRLFAVIEERRHQRPEGSYVAELLDGGLDAVAAKLREESEEVIEAAASGDTSQIAHELADLLFHAWVLMAAVDVSPERVYALLEQRFGTGGVVEKAARARQQRDVE